MPFGIVRQDITTMQVDAIVNASNTSLARGGGVCGAIFQAAGPEEMDKACQALAPIRVGEAVITPGFHLPAKYVIHTAGPIYQGGTKGEPEQLRSSYLNSLRCGPGWGRGSAFYSAGFSREELLQERKRILEKELARINEELEPAEHD
jgi:O-acetyl-ADP-ribose deacetylase (regulator of RNase III)